jgi:hypothetical protein
MPRPPGKSRELRLLISFFEEVDEMFAVLKRAVNDRIAGTSPYTRYGAGFDGPLGAEGDF